MRKCKICNTVYPLGEFYVSYKTNTEHFYSSYCKTCTIQKRLDRRKERYKNKKCGACSKPRLKHTNLCLYHWCRNLLDHQRMNNKLGKDTHKLTLHLLGKLSNQKFKCKYSGIKLIPGLNASLDHIEPFSKSKNYDLSNLCWTDITLNRMKGSKSIEEALIKFNEYQLIFKEFLNESQLSRPS